MNYPHLSLFVKRVTHSQSQEKMPCHTEYRIMYDRAMPFIRYTVSMSHPQFGARLTATCVQIW